MSNPSVPSKKHICTKCNKEYSNRQNLWKHNNKIHPTEKPNPNINIVGLPPQKTTNITQNETKNNINILTLRYILS